jgi:hypothetical protein
MSMIQCKECHKEISSDARACPHCGKKLRGSSLLVILGCVIGFLVIIGIIADSSETKTTVKEGHPKLTVGENAVLSEDGFGCVSEEKVQAFADAAAVNDEYGVANLFKSGDCARVRANTSVLVLDYGRVGKGRLDESRILDGPNAGKVAWIFEGELKPVTQSAK